MIRENARASGFDFDPAAPPRLPNTLKAHMIIRLALGAGRQEETAIGLYRAFWDEARDLGDDETLIEIAAASGVDAAAARKMLASKDEAKSVAAEAGAFRASGVSGVPTFIVGDRIGFTGGMPPDAIIECVRRAQDALKEMN